MKFKEVLVYFAGLFLLVFVVTFLVTYGYNFFFKGICVFDFATPVRFAIILGVVLTWVHFKEE